MHLIHSELGKIISDSRMEDKSEIKKENSLILVTQIQVSDMVVFQPVPLYLSILHLAIFISFHFAMCTIFKVCITQKQENQA